MALSAAPLCLLRFSLPVAVLALLLAPVAYGKVGAALAADADEVGFLGRVTFVVGHGSGDAVDQYGYHAGSYGSLTTGDFPSALFDDAAARTVSRIYEDGDGDWYMYYSGGTANEWLSDQEGRDAVTVKVTYEDGRDTRFFTLGGFIAEVLADNGLRIDPPLPGRDWDSRDGEAVTVEFAHHQRQAAALPLPSGITGPSAPAGNFTDLMNKTPGGPVVTQMLITVGVFLAVLFGVRSGDAPRRVMMCLGALVLTPWIPAIFGFGSFILSSLLTIFVLAGALGAKVLLRPAR